MTTADHEAVGRVLVMIPTYQERESLPLIVARMRKAVPAARILVADDNSPDGTGKIADELAASDDHVHVLDRPAKKGLGAAYVAGFEWALAAGHDAVVEMDADGSHQPEQLPDLLAALTGADVVLGSRWVAGGKVSNWPKSREVLEPWGERIREIHHRHPAARHDWGLSGLSRGGPSILRPDDGAFTGLLLPGRPGAAQFAARVPRGGGADPVRRARTRRQQNEPRDCARSPMAGHRVGHPLALRPTHAPTPSDLGGRRLGQALLRRPESRSKSRRSCRMTSSSGMLRRSRSMSQCVRGALTLNGSPDADAAFALVALRHRTCIPRSPGPQLRRKAEP